MHNALDVIGLNKSYGSFELQDVGFSIATGSIMGFVGPNGAGKTTTIKSILNLVHYSSGEIRILDKAMTQRDVSSDIGVITDSSLYSDDWSIGDVEKVSSLFHKGWSKKSFDTLLGTFALDRRKKVGQLSKGMSVKLMLAVALSHDAKLLILDEPTSGLDPSARDELCDILADYVRNSDKSILFSTHITADLEKIADTVTFILGGRIVFSENKAELLNKYVQVKGSLEDLSDKYRKLIIGFKDQSGEFTGLIKSKDAPQLPEGVKTIPATLDDIVVCLSRRDSHE